MSSAQEIPVIVGVGQNSQRLEDPREAAEGIGRLEKLLKERGRSLDDVEVSISPYLKPFEADALPHYRDAGVDQLIVLAFAADRDSLLAALDGLAEKVVEPARKL